MGAAQMTRPHCTRHDQPGRPLRYAAGLRKGEQPGVFLGGTILWEGPAHTVIRLKSLPAAASEGTEKPWMHITLSPPPSIKMDQQAWMETLHLCLDAMGFPAKTIPWLAFKHQISHAHLLGLPRTFSGRSLDCSNMKQRCDRAETALLHHFSIPTAPRSPLAVNLPKRRQVTPAHAHIAAAVDNVFQIVQPNCLQELRTALWERAEVEVELTPNSHGVRSYVFRYEGSAKIRGKTLSNDLVPSAIKARFELNRKLRDTRATLDQRRLLSALSAHADPLNTILTEISHGDRKLNQPDGLTGFADADEHNARAIDEDRRDDRLDPSDGDGVATAPCAVGAAGGTGIGAGPKSGARAGPNSGTTGGNLNRPAFTGE